MNSFDKSEPIIAKERQIERDIAKFIKEKTGKGPDRTGVKLTNEVAICYFEGYMTKAEELIVQSGHPEQIVEYRSRYILQCIPEIETIFERAIHKQIKYFFPSWIPEKNLACWTIFLD
jgi:uncharacterized protein YbcI